MASEYLQGWCLHQLGQLIQCQLTKTFSQVVVESNKLSLQPPFLQDKHHQFPQSLPIRLVLWTLHQLHCSLDTPQHLSISLVMRCPKLSTVFMEWPHQCQVQ